ncbi:MAG: hypothetical protein IPK35_16545 [Saprospiraceae bacterium]|jgi:Zn-dependent protease with chaperone function|nr:hypothetical protein [Saprospiraceae bacterium]
MKQLEVQLNHNEISQPKTQKVVSPKITKQYLSSIILALICGILMYWMSESFKVSSIFAIVGFVVPFAIKWIKDLLDFDLKF